MLLNVKMREKYGKLAIECARFSIFRHIYLAFGYDDFSAQVSVDFFAVSSPLDLYLS